MNVEEPRQVVSEQVWRKSSYSTGSGGECVEVADRPGTVHVRDSKVEAGPVLSVAADGWAAFVEFAARS